MFRILDAHPQTGGVQNDSVAGLAMFRILDAHPQTGGVQNDRCYGLATFRFLDAHPQTGGVQNDDSGQNRNRITRPHHAADEYAGEEAFAGHHAVADLLIDRAAGMAFFADLRNLEFAFADA